MVTESVKSPPTDAHYVTPRQWGEMEHGGHKKKWPPLNTEWLTHVGEDEPGVEVGWKHVRVNSFIHSVVLSSLEERLWSHSMTLIIYLSSEFLFLCLCSSSVTNLAL